MRTQEMRTSSTGRTGDGWRRSSVSVPEDECVEIWSRPDGVRLRDSKDRKGTELRFCRDSWTLLLDGLHHRE